MHVEEKTNRNTHKTYAKAVYKATDNPQNCWKLVQQQIVSIESCS